MTTDIRDIADNPMSSTTGLVVGNVEAILQAIENLFDEQPDILFYNNPPHLDLSDYYEELFCQDTANQILSDAIAALSYLGSLITIDEANSYCLPNETTVGYELFIIGTVEGLNGNEIFKYTKTINFDS